MARYLVTGGAGFIGSHLVRRLLADGEDVRVLDDFSTGRRANLEPVEGGYELIEGDVRDEAIVAQVMQDVDYVLHQAALPSVPRSIQDPITSADVNIMGTLTVLQAARSAGVTRVVCASSSSVYGASPELPKHERMCPAPLSPYAITKLSGEQFCQNFYRVYGLETVVLRYFNVFGPGQNPESQYAAVIPKFVDALLSRQPLNVHGDGTQSRDFTYIENVVQANLLACTAPKASGEAFNIACGEHHSLNQLIAELEKICDRTAEITYTQPRAGDVAHSLADIEKATEMLGYQPTVAFADGLRRTVKWLMNDTGSLVPGEENERI